MIASDASNETITSANIELIQDDLESMSVDNGSKMFEVPSFFGNLQTSAQCAHHLFQPPTTEQVAHLSLTGPMLAALMYRRKRHVLHACSIVKPDGTAALICGHSTAGKSTLTAALAAQGLAVIADDINALGYHQQQATTYAGLGRIKLWDDALSKLALPVSGRVIRHIQLNPAEDSEYRQFRDKYIVIQPTSIPQAPVTEIIELTVDDRPELTTEEVRGSHKLSIIAANAYRPYMLAPLGVFDQQMRYALQLAKQIRLRRIIRPRDSNTLTMITNLLLDDWAKTCQFSA